MMLGGLAYLYPLTLQENRKKLFEWTGLGLIIGSYLLISSNNVWPGYLAIFPVIGTFLVIQAHKNNSIITNNLVFQKLGAWSYSIYLWHWPIVVAIYTFSLNEFYIYPGILLSVFLGFLSYQHIERIKFRNNFSSFPSYFKCKPIYILGIIGTLGTLIFIKQETITPLRLTAEQISIIEQQKRDPREPVCGKVENGISPMCIYGKGPVKAIVIGDSHAQAQNVAIGNRASLFGGSILSFGLSACNTIKDMYSVDRNGKNPDYNCGKLVANAIKISAEKYPNIPVIIINRTSQNLYGLNEDKDFQLTPPSRFVDKVFTERNDEYRYNITNHMVNTICEFTKTNPVYIMRPTPELKKNIPLTMFRSLTFTNTLQPIKILRNEYNQRQALAFKMQDKAVKQCGAKILDPLPYLCDKDFCYGDKNGIPLYFDDDHLSSYGSTLISPIYDEVF